MSRRNPSSRSASPKVEEKVCISFSSCSTPRRGLFRSSRHLKPISLAKGLYQVLKLKKFGTWDATNITKRHVKHHPFRHCLSRFFTNDGDLQCSGRFRRKCCESGRKVGAIPYRTVCMISCAKAQCLGSWNCVWVPSACSALKSIVRIWTVIGKTTASHKRDWHLPIRSILSAPALGAFLVSLT